MLGFIAILFLLIGAIFVFVAGVGMLRMPDLFMRMSTTTKAATLGVGLMLLGVSIFFGDIATSSRAFVIFAFLLATAPVSAHMIGRAAYSNGAPLWEGTLIDDLEGKYNSDTGELSSGEYGAHTTSTETQSK